MTKALRLLARDEAPIERVPPVPNSEDAEADSEGDNVDTMYSPPPITRGVTEI